ncbi:MAG: GGDEF domain-containing protein, partial [Xanthomonadales bacterium]|nr:GGDEF domain-containing protein [Xanthomonadales bacterium]
TETLTEQLYFLVDRPDGRILATGVSGDWLLWGGDGITSFPADPALGPSSTYPSLRANPDGSMILGTADGQIVFVEPDGTRARAVRIGHDWVGGLHRTADGTVLATTDGATVVAVPWPPSWFLIDAGDGLHGTIHAIRQAGDELYALGSSGVFRIDPAATNTDRAQRLDWTPFEAWDLLDAGDDRLLAGSYQLFRVDRDGRSKAISQRDLYPRSFHPSSFDPDTIWAATEKGLARVARGPEGWSVAADLSSIDTLVTSLIEVSRTELWVGTYGLGALRVTLSPELDEIVAQDTFDELGLSPAVRPSVILREIQAGRYALTADGVYRWTGNEWRSDDLFGLVGILDSGEEIDLRESPDGDLWAFSYRHIYRRSPGEDWLDTYVQAVSTGPFGGIAFTDHGPLFGALAALLRYAGDHDEQTRVQPVVRLRDVRHRAPGEDDRYLVLNDGQPATFAAGHDQFTFRFALQDLRNPEAVRFSGRLRGFEENWSEWSRTAEYTYGSLEPGAYRFEVRGRDSTGQISTAPAFEFAVVPPWHQRTGPRLAALLGLFLFGGIVAAVAMRIRNRQLRRQNRMLEQLVRDRTRALSDANRQLKDLADSDGLTGLANRRRFDAALADLWNLRPLALLMLDVDHFKAYNDSNGHLAGDDLLRSVASILHSEAGRYGATAARYGGEEFTVILPDCNREEAAEIAEGLRRQIETKTPATISIGVAGAVDEDRQPADLVERADRALYRAKELGRNQVVLLSRAED